MFGPYALHKGQIFFESIHCLGIMNIKPIVPGHVLFISKRVCPRFTELSSEEVADLYRSVHIASPILEKHYGAQVSVSSVCMSPQYCYYLC